MRLTARLLDFKGSNKASHILSLTGIISSFIGYSYDRNADKTHGDLSTVTFDNGTHKYSRSGTYPFFGGRIYFTAFTSPIFGQGNYIDAVYRKAIANPFATLSQCFLPELLNFLSH